MRTTINVEDKVFDSLVTLTGARTKTEAVNRALAEYIRLKRKEELIGLSGKIRLKENWRKLRELEKHGR